MGFTGTTEFCASFFSSSSSEESSSESGRFIFTFLSERGALGVGFDFFFSDTILKSSDLFLAGVLCGVLEILDKSLASLLWPSLLRNSQMSLYVSFVTSVVSDMLMSVCLVRFALLSFVFFTVCLILRT